MLVNIQLPIHPDTIIETIRAGGSGADVQTTIQRFTIAIAKNSTVNVVIPIKSGYVAIGFAPIEVSADYFYSGTVVSIRGDTQLDAQQSDIALTDPIELRFIDKYRVLKDTLTFTATVDNGTNAPANTIITVTFNALFVTKAYYEQFYRPLMELNYKVLQDIIVQGVVCE